MNKVEIGVYEKPPTPKSQVLKPVYGRSHESLRFWTFFYVKAKVIELSGEESWYQRALPLRFPCLSHLHAGLMGQSQFEPSHPLVVIPRDPSEIMFLVPVLNHCWALHTWCAFSTDLFLGEGELKHKDQVLAPEQRSVISIRIEGEHKPKIKMVPSTLRASDNKTEHIFIIISESLLRRICL